MKLSKCILGRLVITKEKEVGHIVGLAYNMDLQFAEKMSAEELLDRTVPIVRFPKGERKIHPANIELFVE